MQRRWVNRGWAQIGCKVASDIFGREDRFGDSAGLACDGCDRCIGYAQGHHIGDRPNKITAALDAGRVLEPNRANDSVVPAYRHDEQGPAAEGAQDSVELYCTAIPSSIGGLDLLAAQQVAEKPRQFIAVQLKALDVSISLAIEAVFAK